MNPPLSKFVYGTTRLGDESISVADRVSMARFAITKGIWFHTSSQYGNALDILNQAFQEEPTRVPPVIVKLGWESVEQIRGQIVSQIEALGIKKLAVGQLCLGGALAEQFANGGPALDDLRRLKDDGIVDNFVLETWPWSSENILKGFEIGSDKDFIEAPIFYFNPLQRFASNDLWDFIQDRKRPFIAMRTVAGGSVDHILSSENAPEYLKKRAAEVKPVFEKSGCLSWPEFCTRFIFGHENAIATVGATSQPENLDELLRAVGASTPLPAQIQSELTALQRNWATEHDQFAAPWSM